jgi:hypothetical protein
VTLLTFRAEPTNVEGVRVDDNIGSAAFSFGGIVLTAVGGHRSAPDENVSFASGTVAVPITSMLALTIGGGSYPSNRLTGAAGGHFFSSGVSLRFGGQGGHAPEPSGVQPPVSGFTRLALKAPNATQVEVAGDWNNWAHVPATRAANGVWYADIPLAPGEYRYSFLVEGHEWRVPDGVQSVDDGFGSKSAYVTVRAPSGLNQERK